MAKLQRQKIDQWWPGDRGGERSLTAKEHEDSYGDDGTSQYLDCAGMC